MQLMLNMMFTVMFTAEMIVKLVACGFNQYWLDPWNRFDALVVHGSWLDVVVTFFAVDFVSASLFRIVRLARVVGRVGRLFKGLRILTGIDAIMKTFLSSLPALSYITLFIVLEIFCFAVIAMNTFGAVRFNGCLDHNRNFRSVDRTILSNT